jgi:hypothetical protein
VFLKVFAAGLLIVLLLVAGCIAIIAAVAKDVEEEVNAHAITLAQFRSIELRTSRKAVQAKLGKPADAQESVSENVFTKEPSNTSCIYYHRRQGKLGDVFQFCFAEGRLVAKNSF